jgi:hypothetical protein
MNLSFPAVGPTVRPDTRAKRVDAWTIYSDQLATLTLRPQRWQNVFSLSHVDGGRCVLEARLEPDNATASAYQLLEAITPLPTAPSARRLAPSHGEPVHISA